MSLVLEIGNYMCPNILVQYSGFQAPEELGTTLMGAGDGLRK